MPATTSAARTRRVTSPRCARSSPTWRRKRIMQMREVEILRTRGVDHLAIVADDMPAAMDFYTRVMNSRLVHVRRVPYEQDRGQPPYDNLRHYFFDMGNDSLFAVFEYPKGLPRQNRDPVGGMQHVAFHWPLQRCAGFISHAKRCGVQAIR